MASMNRNTSVSNAPILRLNFCPLKGHKSKSLRTKSFKFSEEMPNTIKNSCEKFHGLGFRRFCATFI